MEGLSRGPCQLEIANGIILHLDIVSLLVPTDVNINGIWGGGHHM